MKGEPLPNSDHIARYCKPMCVPDGEIQATAFMIRQNDENLSVNWLEYLNCSSRENEVSEIRNIYSSKLKVSTKARVAILNVGQVKQKIFTDSEDRRNIEILHDPKIDDPPDPSHSGIYNLRPDDELIAELIRETVLESYPVRI